MSEDRRPARFWERISEDDSVYQHILEFADGRNPVFTAIELLTDAPVEVRRRFIDGYAESMAESDDPRAAADPRSVAMNNIGYVCGYYGSSENVQRTLDAWREADLTLIHPIFGKDVPTPEAAAIRAQIDVLEDGINGIEDLGYE